MSNIIETKDLVKIYNPGQRNELKVLKGINVKIKKGDFLTIFGPSGSGKSTLLHMMGCLDRPSSGKVFIEGVDTSKLSDDELAKIRREKIGFVFQQFNLISSLTALENVEIAKRIDGNSRGESKERAKKLLESVGLGDRLNHQPNKLSGGEMQRVAIARALANSPEVILADEPTGNLDRKTGGEIIKIMKDLNVKGYTFVIVTHDPDIAKHARRSIGIKDGKILSDNE